MRLKTQLSSRRYMHQSVSKRKLYRAGILCRVLMNQIMLQSRSEILSDNIDFNFTHANSKLS